MSPTIYQIKEFGDVPSYPLQIVCWVEPHFLIQQLIVPVVVEVLETE